MYKLKSVHPKRNQKCMKAINYICFKLEEKDTRSVRKDKNNFINVIGDKLLDEEKQQFHFIKSFSVL